MAQQYHNSPTTSLPQELERDKSTAEVCLNELGNVASFLDATVTELYNRLNCICRQEPMPVEKLDTSAFAPYSPYFDSMRDKTHSLNNSLDRLNALLSLLEV